MPPVSKNPDPRVDVLITVIADLITSESRILGELDLYVTAITAFLDSHPADDENTAVYAKVLLDRIRNSARNRLAENDAAAGQNPGFHVEVRRHGEADPDRAAAPAATA